MTLREQFESLKYKGYVCDADDLPPREWADGKMHEKVGGKWREVGSEEESSNKEKNNDDLQPRESIKEIKNNFEKAQKLKSTNIDKNKVFKTKEDIEAYFEKTAPVQNKTDNNTAIFPKTTAGKIIYHKGFPIGQTIESLPALFESAQFIYSEPEKKMEGHKYHPNIECYKNYLNKIEFHGTEYFVRFTTREEKVVKKRKSTKSNDQVHSIAISDIEITKAYQPYQTEQTSAESAKSKPFLDKRLQQLKEKINENQTKDATLLDIFEMIKRDKYA